MAPSMLTPWRSQLRLRARRESTPGLPPHGGILRSPLTGKGPPTRHLSCPSRVVIYRKVVWYNLPVRGKCALALAPKSFRSRLSPPTPNRQSGPPHRPLGRLASTTERSAVSRQPLVVPQQCAGPFFARAEDQLSQWDSAMPARHPYAGVLDWQSEMVDRLPLSGGER